MKFRSRNIGNQPIVEITANNFEHLISSRYFLTYTYDKKFTIQRRDKFVKFVGINDTYEQGMVIGFIVEE